jgi:hypothetical protein
MVLKSIVNIINKNNKYGEEEPNTLFYSKKTSKMKYLKLPAKFYYFRKIQNGRRRVGNFFITCKIKLICLSSHKKIGLSNLFCMRKI